IVGGGPYAGAPALAGLAALRTGAERATLFVPQPADARAQAFSPNLVVRAFGEGHFQPRDVRAIRNALYEAPPKAVLVGMGAGRDRETVEALHLLLEALVGTVPLVVDADGLDALPPSVERRLGYDLVATPNAGEFVRVFGGVPGGNDAERLPAVREIAAARGLTMLVKGQPDMISDGRHASVNRHHALPMTVSGVGDVLAGAVGALLADGVPAYGACRLASYLVGDAGLRATESRGYGLVATDIIEEIPAALVEGLRRVRVED
ncbi:MAG: NAD(P)H-hydrate dehydratase, partial [Thermoplasmata archaeon]|nr:NAD(P)H-hydrate dehydratase [Thermoplasmata archaeon]